MMMLYDMKKGVSTKKYGAHGGYDDEVGVKNVMMKLMMIMCEVHEKVSELRGSGEIEATLDL